MAPALRAAVQATGAESVVVGSVVSAWVGGRA
jgi:hypothetical protein